MKQKSNLNHPLCFPGILEKVDYLDDLGVDSVWLSPFYSYGGVDMGYDWLDHTKVDYRRVYAQNIKKLNLFDILSSDSGKTTTWTSSLTHY